MGSQSRRSFSQDAETALLSWTVVDSAVVGENMGRASDFAALRCKLGRRKLALRRPCHPQVAILVELDLGVPRAFVEHADSIGDSLDLLGVADA